MSIGRTTRFIALGVLGALAVAGSAAAAVFLLRGRHDVTTSSDEAYRFYKLGRENEDKLYHKEAAAAYAKSLEADPNFVMATFRLGRVLQDRDSERAKTLINSAARRKDQVTLRERMILEIGLEQVGERDPKKLKPLLDKFVELFPSDIEGYTSRAYFLMRTGKQDEAVAEYEKALTVNPNYAFAYNMLGYHWMSRGDYGKSEECFKKYRFLAPDQANPHDSLGELYAAIGRYDEAEESLNRALAVKDDFYPSIAHLGTVEVGRGNLAKAAERFHQASQRVETTGMRYDFLVAAVLCHLDAGETQKGKELLATVVTLVDGASASDKKRLELDLPLFRALMDLRMDDVASAEANVKKVEESVAKLDEKKYERLLKGLCLVRAFLRAKQGKLEEAVADFGKQLEKVPGQKIESLPYFDFLGLARMEYASCLAKLGRVEEAEAALQPILSRNPRFQPAVAVLESIKNRGREATPEPSIAAPNKGTQPAVAPGSKVGTAPGTPDANVPSA